MNEGVSWFSTGVDYASFQENTVAMLALVYHATSTGSEQLLKEHMAVIITGFFPRQQKQVVFPPEHDAPRGGRLHLVWPAKMCASWPTAMPTRTTSEWSPTKVHHASALRGPLHCHF